MSGVRFYFSKNINNTNIHRVLVVIETLYEIQRKKGGQFADKERELIAEEILIQQNINFKQIDFSDLGRVKEFFRSVLEQIELRPNYEEAEEMLSIYQAIQGKVENKNFKDLEELVNYVETWYKREPYYKGCYIDTLLCRLRDNKFLESIL